MTGRRTAVGKVRWTASSVGLTLLVICSASSAMGQTPEQYQATKRKLIEQFHSCVISQAVTIDDRTSDASTIARGAVALCAREANSAAVANAGNYSELVPRFQEQLEKSGVEIGLAGLLKARADAGRRASPPPRTKPKPKGEQI